MRIVGVTLALVFSVFVNASTDKPTLIQNAALVITMDPALGTGPLGVLEGADVLFDRTGILAVGPTSRRRTRTCTTARTAS